MKINPGRREFSGLCYILSSKKTWVNYLLIKATFCWSKRENCCLQKNWNNCLCIAKAEFQYKSWIDMTHLSLGKSIIVLLCSSFHQHQTIQIVKAPVQNRFGYTPPDRFHPPTSIWNASTRVHWNSKHQLPITQFFLFSFFPFSYTF